MNLNILLVEDDEIEVLKLKRTFKKLNYRHSVTVAKNGEEALLLCNKASPNLIFLDLNMPKMSGLEFLSILKKDEYLKYIPTIIFTTSCNHSDVIEAYKIGIAGYVIKPLRYESYINQIEKVVNYWSINELVKK